MHAAKRVRVKCLHTLLGLNLAAGPQQEHTQPGCHHAQQLDNVLLRLTCRDAPVQQGSWARSSWPTPTASGSWRGSIAGFSSAADTSIQTQQAAAPLPTPHSVPSPPSESPAGEAPPRRRVPKPRRLEPRKISLPPPVLVMRVFAVFTITVAAGARRGSTHTGSRALGRQDCAFQALCATRNKLCALSRLLTGLVAYDTHVWPRLIEQLRSDDEEARQAAMLAVPTSVPFEVTTPPFVAQSGIAVLLSNLEEPKASQNSEGKDNKH